MYEKILWEDKEWSDAPDKGLPFAWIVLLRIRVLAAVMADNQYENCGNNRLAPEVRQTKSKFSFCELIHKNYLPDNVRPAIDGLTGGKDKPVWTYLNVVCKPYRLGCIVGMPYVHFDGKRESFPLHRKAYQTKENREVKKKYPSIEYEEKAVDDIAGDLISKPESFGVIVTTNMFGDILSDEGASLVSGLCVGSNIGERTRLYMPVRHSALYQYINDDSFDSHVSMMCISELLNDLGEATAAKELNSKIFKICGKGSNYLEKLLDSI